MLIAAFCITAIPYFYLMLPLAAPATVAQIIKQCTADNHTALETLLLPQLEAIRAAQDYMGILKSFYGFFKPVENLIEQFIDESILPDINTRRKASLLLHDLTFFKAHTAEIALATHLPKITNVPQALGALYVLEGSTLGGRGITKMLQKNEAAQLDNAAMKFFSGYGAATGTMWTTFLQKLNNYTTDNNEIEEMIEAANQTFLQFKNWLQKQENSA